MNDTSERSEPCRLPAGKPAILLVEDEGLIRFILAEELRLSGVHVIEAANADEAVTILAARSINLVLTDVRMPGTMDGLQLAQHVRHNYPAVNIVLMSGHFPPERALTSADALLMKPFDMAAAAAMIKQLLLRER